MIPNIFHSYCFQFAAPVVNWRKQILSYHAAKPISQLNFVIVIQTKATLLDAQNNEFFEIVFDECLDLCNEIFKRCPINLLMPSMNALSIRVTHTTRSLHEQVAILTSVPCRTCVTRKIMWTSFSGYIWSHMKVFNRKTSFSATFYIS